MKTTIPYTWKKKYNWARLFRLNSLPPDFPREPDVACKRLLVQASFLSDPDESLRWREGGEGESVGPVLRGEQSVGRQRGEREPPVR